MKVWSEARVTCEVTSQSHDWSSKLRSSRSRNRTEEELKVRVTAVEMACGGVKVAFCAVPEQQNVVLVAQPRSWGQRMRRESGFFSFAREQSGESAAKLLANNLRAAISVPLWKPNVRAGRHSAHDESPPHWGRWSKERARQELTGRSED